MSDRPLSLLDGRLNRWPSARERFFASVSPEPNTGCWLWDGVPGAGGYGRIRVGGRKRAAHRVGWEIHYGAIPAGKVICHRCDQPACVNPAHLFIGTTSDNMRDMTAKGRRRGGASKRTHCPRGHAYDQANTYVYRNAQQCRACHRVIDAARSPRRRRQS